MILGTISTTRGPVTTGIYECCWNESSCQPKKECGTLPLSVSVLWQAGRQAALSMDRKLTTLVGKRCRDSFDPASICSNNASLKGESDLSLRHFIDFIDFNDAFIDFNDALKSVKS
jgi:hypothetical protein